jgi:hypothetical protein
LASPEKNFKKGLKRRWRSLLILFAFSAGSFFYIFEHFSFFILRNYRIIAPDEEVETLVWKYFPAGCVRYWPLLIFDFPNTVLFLERVFPVTVQTRALGIGTFQTEIQPLNVWLQVEWRGRKWFLADNGTMWNVSEFAMSKLAATRAAKVKWQLTSSFGTAEDGAVLSGMVPSVVPMEEFKRIVDEITVQPWYQDVSAVVFGRRGGQYLIEITVNRGKQWIDFVLQGNRFEWEQINAALQFAFLQIEKEGGNFRLDMTYTDKIVVTRKQDAKEGSSR